MEKKQENGVKTGIIASAVPMTTQYKLDSLQKFLLPPSLSILCPRRTFKRRATWRVKQGIARVITCPPKPLTPSDSESAKYLGGSCFEACYANPKHAKEDLMSQLLIYLLSLESLAELQGKAVWNLAKRRKASTRNPKPF